MNLDTLQREGGDRPPFPFVHGGKRFELCDPLEIDIQELEVSAHDSRLLLRLAMGDDQADTFFKVKLPAWKLEALAMGWAEHFGLSELLGNTAASPT